jgi:hypothetical protein
MCLHQLLGGFSKISVYFGGWLKCQWKWKKFLLLLSNFQTSPNNARSARLASTYHLCGQCEPAIGKDLHVSGMDEAAVKYTHRRPWKSYHCSAVFPNHIQALVVRSGQNSGFRWLEPEIPVIGHQDGVPGRNNIGGARMNRATVIPVCPSVPHSLRTICVGVNCARLTIDGQGTNTFALLSTVRSYCINDRYC